MNRYIRDAFLTERGRIQAALTRPAASIHLAGDYLGTLYAETAIEIGSRAATTILRDLGSGYSDGGA